MLVYASGTGETGVTETHQFEITPAGSATATNMRIGATAATFVIDNNPSSALAGDYSTPTVFVGVRVGNQARAYTDGAFRQSWTTGTRNGSLTGLVAGRRTGNNAANLTTYMMAVWDRALSDAEILRLGSNPWQLFEPQRIWVPSSAVVSEFVTLDLPIAYAVRGAVAAQLEVSYSVAGKVERALTGAYTVIGGAAADLAAQYVINGEAHSDLEAQFVVRGRAQSDLVSTFAVKGRVQSDLAGASAVRGSVVAELLASYQIEAAHAVTSDLAAGYNVLGRARADLGANYGIAAAVERGFIAAWSVRGAVTRDLAGEFLVRDAVEQDLVGEFAVCGHASTDLVAEYALLPSTGGGAGPSAAEIATAVWARILTGPRPPGSAGSMLQDASARVSTTL